MATPPKSSSETTTGDGSASRRRRTVVRINNRGSSPSMPPLPQQQVHRRILSDSTNNSRTPLPAKFSSHLASTSGTKPLTAGCMSMECRNPIPTNLTIYGHVDQQLEDTIRTLRKRNIGIVIREEAEMNRLFQESKKRKQEAMGQFKGKGKQKEKENQCPTSTPVSKKRKQEAMDQFKGKGKQKGKENQCPTSTSVGEKGNFVSRSAIGRYARKQNAISDRGSRTPETPLQPRFIPSLNPRHAQLGNVERENKRVRFSPVVSSSLPTNLQRVNEITPNSFGLHHMAVNLFETVFGLDCQTNSVHSLPEPEQPLLDYTPTPLVRPSVIPETSNLVPTPVVIHGDLHVFSEPTNINVEPFPDELSCRHDLGLMNVECPHCSALHWMEEKLQKSSKYRPMFGKCCLQGKIHLPDLINPPPAIQALYDGTDAQSNSFRNHIRQYNAANAFTSLGVQMDDRLRAGSGPTSFTIHGELRHRTGTLIPATGQEPVYAQLYIYDPEPALDFRSRRNPQLRRDVLGIIQDCMKTHNHFYNKYREAAAVLQQLDEQQQQLPVYLHYISATDHRRYNLPTIDQIAILLPGDGTEVSGVRDIIIHLKGNNQLMRINECHPAYLPLHYVLFFPRGEPGWEPEMEQWNVLTGTHNGLRLTQLQFFCFRMFQRSREYSTILRGGKLFQEFIVDAWAATEQNRLSYFRFNQGKLRAEVYRGLTDIAADGAALHDVGKRFILPSSFVGGPRHMFEIFQDSMAITRFNQHPDIFFTMTANPKWLEITSALLPNQNATDRPDLVARVFELKRKALMKDIDNGGVFGQKVAHVYTIEFQKRGLPHMHLLIFLKGQDKIKTCAQVNRCVSAEFPDAKQDPALYDTVRKCMIHGPCGTRNPLAPCMENGKCTKGYPKKFIEETSMGEDGYPIYRRRDDGQCHVSFKGQPVDNRDVVPYNAYFSRKFNCHINVEVCAGLRAVKYIHKYIYKGHDRATIVIGEPDEIKQYLDARYVGPPEAAWRIFGHSMHEEIPNVVRLSLHLEGMHNVIFNPDEPMEAIVARGAAEMTTLTAFFKCCMENESARQLTYQEMPQSWVWRKGEKIWTPRHQGRAIGRMYFASPREGERFYLRLLLTVVKGPQSYRDLRTVNDVEYPSFKEACIAKGLLEDDAEWKQCLSEAAVMNTGSQLRRLFCVILTHCSPQQPKLLWDHFCVHICDDLEHKLRTIHGVHSPTTSQIEDYGLYLLNLLLQESGKSLKDFPRMPLPIGDWSTTSGNRLIHEHRQLETEALQKDVNVDIDRLNVEQKSAYDVIISSVLENKGMSFFLNGGAGTGKTFLYNTLATKCRALGNIVVSVASSGIASQLLIGGRTAHSTFCIPLDIQENSMCAFNKQSALADLLRQTKLIIWDEVPMQHKHCVESVERTLQDIYSNQKSFGGITVVLGGDFRQVLPVVPKGAREQIVSVSLRRSYLWNKLNLLSLTKNMRLDANEPRQSNWANFLIKIGSTEQEIAQLPSTIARCNNLSELIATVYPHLDEPDTTTPAFLNERTILAARNDDVSAINDVALNVFPGEIITYLAADKMSEDVDLNRNMENRYPNEFLNSLNPPGLPPFRIDLKVGCPIMLLRNIAPKDGLCNGTRLVVVKCAEFVIEAQILTGDKRGDRVFIPRISLTPSSSELVIKMSRRQFPIRLAYAMTINKSQGQSVKFVGLDLRTPVFSHGQLYVALSRCTSSDRISILLPPDSADSTTNIVYPESWDDAVAAYKITHSTNRRGWRMNNRIYVTTGCRWPSYVDIDSPMFCKLMLRMFKDNTDGRR